ncbi:piggyBac transposable element-derived protein 4-like [Aricia agestis]|uniref:piggyBac transposable element-derived protein 4-like n=1 Tax=Aricia agestis TaxID=91739 RepID=UPI001C20672C|nr:piggyBac transposable element-derived protein 4-like [Aricia agestis]
MPRFLQDSEIERCLLENDFDSEDEAISAENDCESDHCSIASECLTEVDAEEDEEYLFLTTRGTSRSRSQTIRGASRGRSRTNRGGTTGRSRSNRGTSRGSFRTNRGASRGLQPRNQCTSQGHQSPASLEILRRVTSHQADSRQNSLSPSAQYNLDSPTCSTALDDQGLSNDVFIAKDGTNWQKLPPRSNVRTRDENIVRGAPGVKSQFQQKKSHLECFEVFISEPIMDVIWLHTNEKISTSNLLENRTGDKLDSTRAGVTRAELKALFGLLLLAGLYRSGRQNTEDLWATDGTGIEVFRLTMSRNRFMFLLEKLRFDDMYSRAERAKYDKLAPIREVFEYFVTNCQNSFSPYEYLTLDEELVAFRGRCPFRQYIPSKPAKYGIKIYALVDNKTYFSCNLEVYCGKQPEGSPYAVSNKPHDLVKRMINCVSGTARNITMNNYFTSYETTMELLQDHKLTVVGTLRANKTYIPQEFKKAREKYTSLFGFQDKVTIVSYVPKPRKMVYLMSSMHHDCVIDPETGVQQKPEMITFYNATKSGVDVVDKLARTYDVSRNSQRWPLTIFFSLLNHAGINAMVMYMLNNGTNKGKTNQRREFIKKLGLSLIEEQQKIRKENERLPRELRKRVAEHLGEPLSPPKKTKKPNSRQRCSRCPRSKDRKSTRACAKCDAPLCLEHSIYICKDCADLLENA